MHANILVRDSACCHLFKKGRQISLGPYVAGKLDRKMSTSFSPCARREAISGLEPLATIVSTAAVNSPAMSTWSVYL